MHDSGKNNTHTQRGQQRIKKRECVRAGDGELKDLLLPQADRLSGGGCWVVAQLALINTRLILPHDSP